MYKILVIVTTGHYEGGVTTQVIEFNNETDADTAHRRILNSNSSNVTSIKLY